MKWQEISIKTDKRAVDAVAGILMECGAGGVVIEDPDMINEQIAEGVWDAFEFPDELLQRDFLLVKAYFPCDLRIEDRNLCLHEKINVLNREYLPDSIKGVGFAQVRDEDWANSWKAFYKPVKVSNKIVIKPSWEAYTPGPGELVIELDPGMAFGTGTHPTTIMCIKLLEQVMKGGETVFDIGTGSGILSVAAARLGAGKVVAVDVDDVAVEAARSNAVLNQVGQTVTVLSGNLLDNLSGKADIVVANIVADVIIGLCPDAFKAVRTGGKFISSGIISARETKVLQTIADQGFRIKQVVRDGEWVSVLASREG